MSVERGQTNICPECQEPIVENQSFEIGERPAVRKVGGLGVLGLVISGVIAGNGAWLDYPLITMAGGASAAATVVAAFLGETYFHIRYDQLEKRLNQPKPKP